MFFTQAETNGPRGEGAADPPLTEKRALTPTSPRQKACQVAPAWDSPLWGGGHPKEPRREGAGDSGAAGAAGTRGRSSQGSAPAPAAASFSSGPLPMTT